MNIHCCGCGTEVVARLTDGKEIYPNTSDLHHLPFWKCDKCNNYVGCHYKSKNNTKPLGCIPTKELRKARSHIHALIDPLWKQRLMDRKDIYQELSEIIGWEYHTAKIKTIEEARIVYKAARQVVNNLRDEILECDKEKRGLSNES